MLVLSRKVGEAVQIGDDIRLIVRRIEGSRVSLAIEAPREISIRREDRPASLAPNHIGHDRGATTR